MKFKDLLEDWNINNLKINLGFLETDWCPQDDDKNAAWELYVELITRVTTQYLQPEDGDEETALESIHKIFDLTREIIKKYGRRGENFTKLAVVVLNQVIRPFTAKWHRLKLQNAFEDENQCQIFRDELSELQANLRKYTKLLASIAGVEDLTDINVESK